MFNKNKKNNVKKGRLGEDIACEYLSKVGFLIYERNYRKKFGEIDIIAKKDNKIHFFEVKSVEINDLNSYFHAGNHRPEENVNLLKMHKIKKVLKTYFDEKNEDKIIGDFVFNVICVYLNFVSRKAKVKIIENIIL